MFKGFLCEWKPTDSHLGLHRHRSYQYLCTDKSMSLYILWYIAKSHILIPLLMKWQNFSSGLQYEHSCFTLNLLASVKVIPIFALRVSHF